jgi:PKD repeat protein
MFVPRPAVLAALAFLASAGAARAEGPAIDHSEIKCLVAGKYRKMPAKFSPADVAQPRVYFRPEGVPSWYYVEMKPEDPLGHVGVLPKPTKKLVKKHIEYYVEAASKDFDTGRTPEYAPIVVAKEGDCGRDPLVPLYSKNPPSAVFPSLPPGFAVGGAAGIGTAAAVVGGGAAAAGGVILATRGGDDAGASTATTAPTTTTVTVPATSPTTSTTQPAAPIVNCQVDVREGPVPLTVNFSAQASGSFDYLWDFGDGGTSTQVSPSHTFTVPGAYQVTVRASNGALVATCTRTVTAQPATTDFPLTVRFAGAGTGTVSGLACTAPCTASYASNAMVVLSATPTGGSSFAGWSGDCSGIVCTVTMDGPHDVTATFNPPAPTFPLVVTIAGTGTGTVTGTGINCPGDCTESYTATTGVTLTPTATGGSTFTGFSGDCTGTTCALTMNGPRNVTATFTAAAPTFTLSVSVGGGGTGTLTATGINCPGDCTEAYPAGTPVALTATPTGGSTFGSWTGDCVGTTGLTCNLTMSANRTAGATFAPPAAFPLTVLLAGSGTGTVMGNGCPAPCTQSFPAGTPVTLGASPNAGSSFTGWSGDCTGTGACNLTMNVAHTVTATFDLAAMPAVLTLTVFGPATSGSQVVAFPPAQTCTGTPGGTVCIVPFTLGATATLVPSSTSLVASWSGDCAGTPDGANCMLAMTANRSATANFISPGVTDAQRSGSTVASRLESAGARLAASLNDTPLAPPPPGASTWTVEPRTGDNRLEAQLQAGAAGTWRLELAGVQGLVRGSLRVLAGEVVSLGPDAVVFRLKGRAGERVSLGFTVR